MQALGLLGSAFVSILNPASILLMIAGVAIGIVFGVPSRDCQLPWQ